MKKRGNPIHNVPKVESVDPSNPAAPNRVPDYKTPAPKQNRKPKGGRK